jgi:pimeloyl-ACP methyl ester carboxylesterase
MEMRGRNDWLRWKLVVVRRHETPRRIERVLASIHRIPQSFPCGHFAQLERPAEVAASIERFVAAMERPGF